MRVCPECGYEDLPIWRNTRWCLYTEHCHISELEAFDPGFAKKLRPSETIFVNGVKYQLNKRGSHVHRIAAKYTERPKSHSLREPHGEKPYLNPLSHKLEEFV